MKKKNIKKTRQFLKTKDRDNYALTSVDFVEMCGAYHEAQKLYLSSTYGFQMVQNLFHFFHMTALHTVKGFTRLLQFPRKLPTEPPIKKRSWFFSC